MKRRELLEGSTVAGLVAAASLALRGRRGEAGPVEGQGAAATPAAPLKPPARGAIPVAFLVSEGAVIIDFCGPWEVFQDVSVPGRDGNAFDLYTVAETTKPIHASGGMKIVPDHDFLTAPAPKVIVIPAQSAPSEKTLQWVRTAAKSADVTMSVCTGAFLLAKTGLLSGKGATTHHDSYRGFAMTFPDIQLKRGARFVEEGNLATAGGLSSGIDLALRVVERYFGREVATKTAYAMEYQGQGWMNAESNQVYAQAHASTEENPLCPVCEMEVDAKVALKSVYKGKTYYFCSADHKQQFDATPEKFLAAMKAQ
jgi:transcriptional regulator GlxA family with amidase domain